MSSLATMLHRAGLIGEDEAARAASRARERGGSIVASLVELGLAKEGQLVAFVQSKLLIPQVSPSILAVLEQPAISNIDAELAWRYEVLPISIDDVGNLTIAMSDPTDVAAVDAIVERTQAYVIRAVAPRTALLRALDRFYGPPTHDHRLAAPEPGVPHPAQTGTTAPPTESSPRAWVDDSTDATDPESPADRSVLGEPLSAAAFARVLPQLLEASSRDEITSVLLSFLAEGFGRVILFVHTQATLRGRDCMGEDLLVEAVRQVRIPVAGPSTFSTVIDTGKPYFGPWKLDTRINEMFGHAMGGIRGNVLVLPVRLGVRVPLLVFAANTPHPVDPRSLAELVDAVSSALERLILSRKSQDNLPSVDE